MQTENIKLLIFFVFYSFLFHWSGVIASQANTTVQLRSCQGSSTPVFCQPVFCLTLCSVNFLFRPPTFCLHLCLLTVVIWHSEIFSFLLSIFYFCCNLPCSICLVQQPSYKCDNFRKTDRRTDKEINFDQRIKGWSLT